MSELGTKLRDARVEKGYTLNTLQQMTKIQKKYLQAIELGNYDEMPGSFYVRAFVKQYADTVGLDGDKLLEEYENELSLNQDEDAPIEEKEALPSRSQRYEEKEKNSIESLVSYIPLALLVTIVVAIMIFLVVAINNINNENRAEESASVDSSTSIVSIVEPESSVTSSANESSSANDSVADIELGENDFKVGDQVLSLVSDIGEATTYQLNAAFSDYKFEVEGNSYVWVGVFEDGAIVEDTTIVEGETLEYTPSAGTQEVRVAFGYAEGANLLVNGTLVEPAGQYLTETIIFIAADGLDSTDESTSIDSDIPEETTTTDNYEGPAVLDPANNMDGTE